ncbi:MAG: ABC transporter ATP-binding protein [Lachnospiraceae bacterium]|nr:ABC transporter ATP-binding protein [Lachnospiraceae bacterium]MBR6150646.1 ABC transporter ATP-binding protein [Lachnospiraceae bacterium]
MAAVCLETQDLCKTYIVEGYSNNVLQNINLKVEEGEFVSIMGPSGSGKSTLLYTISGMDGMTAGNVIFDGEDLSKMSEKELTKLRLLKMGFIFQQMYMMKKLCIMDNVVLPGYQAKLKTREEVNQRAEELLRRLGIVETANREITEVSGGQLQRACLARALINSPKVLFADEPTGALNSKASMEVLDEMIKANEAGTTILMVTHSEKVAALSDRIIYLIDGNIQGELVLGKIGQEERGHDGDKKAEGRKLENRERLMLRERKLRVWLEGLGW